MNFENVVKSSIFLADMNDFKIVNQVYNSYFKNDSAPARETIAVKALPKSVNVEISTFVGIENTFTVNVGVTTTGGLVGPLQMEFICSILENSTS